MNENAKKWVAALRSGEYKQTMGQLAYTGEDGASYCCLGVACELYCQEHDDLARVRKGGHTLAYQSSDLTHESLFLPGVVKEWLGLESRRGSYGYNPPLTGPRGALSQMNDDGASFEEIADAIEEEPPGLFTS